MMNRSSSIVGIVLEKHQDHFVVQRKKKGSIVKSFEYKSSMSWVFLTGGCKRCQRKLDIINKKLNWMWFYIKNIIFYSQEDFEKCQYQDITPTFILIYLLRALTVINLCDKDNVHPMQ